MNRVGLVLGCVVIGTIGALVLGRKRKQHAKTDATLSIEREIEQDFVVEDSGWAPDLANAALDRLVHGTPELARFHVRIVWMSRMLAFTLPGRALYLTRALMDRPGFTMAHAAFVIAHEAAHHALGHLGDARSSFSSVLGARLSHAFIGAQRELDADAYALRACLRAGFKRDDVIGVFDVLSAYAEDYGEVDDDDDADRRTFFEKLRGHPSLSTRRAALARL